MRQKIVGVFRLGDEFCELVLREGTGGEFYFTPGDGHVPRIEIGGDYDSWGRVVNCLVHESVEFSLARLKCRFLSQDDNGDDAHGYLFVASHPDFSDACARAAIFITDALPPLATKWKGWKKK